VVVQGPEVHALVSSVVYLICARTYTVFLCYLRLRLLMSVSACSGA
jgi:hypothetical protein